MSDKFWMCFSKKEFFNSLGQPDFAFKAYIYTKYYMDYYTGIVGGSPKHRLSYLSYMRDLAIFPKPGRAKSGMRSKQEVRTALKQLQDGIEQEDGTSFKFLSENLDTNNYLDYKNTGQKRYLKFAVLNTPLSDKKNNSVETVKNLSNASNEIVAPKTNTTHLQHGQTSSVTSDLANSNPEVQPISFNHNKINNKNTNSTEDCAEVFNDNNYYLSDSSDSPAKEKLTADWKPDLNSLQILLKDKNIDISCATPSTLLNFINYNSDKEFKTKHQWTLHYAGWIKNAIDFDYSNNQQQQLNQKIALERYQIKHEQNIQALEYERSKFKMHLSWLPSLKTAEIMQILQNHSSFPKDCPNLLNPDFPQNSLDDFKLKRMCKTELKTDQEWTFEFINYLKNKITRLSKKSNKNNAVDQKIENNKTDDKVTDDKATDDKAENNTELKFTIAEFNINLAIFKQHYMPYSEGSQIAYLFNKAPDHLIHECIVSFKRYHQQNYPNGVKTANNWFEALLTHILVNLEKRPYVSNDDNRSQAMQSMASVVGRLVNPKQAQVNKQAHADLMNKVKTNNSQEEKDKQNQIELERKLNEPIAQEASQFAYEQFNNINASINQVSSNIVNKFNLKRELADVISTKVYNATDKAKISKAKLEQSNPYQLTLKYGIDICKKWLNNSTKEENLSHKHLSDLANRKNNLTTKLTLHLLKNGFEDLKQQIDKNFDAASICMELSVNIITQIIEIEKQNILKVKNNAIATNVISSHQNEQPCANNPNNLTTIEIQHA